MAKPTWQSRVTGSNPLRCARERPLCLESNLHLEVREERVSELRRFSNRRSPAAPRAVHHRHHSRRPPKDCNRSEAGAHSRIAEGLFLPKRKVHRAAGFLSAFLLWRSLPLADFESRLGAWQFRLARMICGSYRLNPSERTFPKGATMGATNRALLHLSL